MSKLNRSSIEWLDLVFEDKNKMYGAYQLRKEDNKTTLKAFITTLLFITLLFLVAFFFSSFSTKPEKPIDDLGTTVVLAHIKPNVSKPDVVKVNPVKKGAPLKQPLTQDLTTNIQVVDENIATKIPITENNETGLTKNPNALESGDGKGAINGASVAKGGGEVKTEIDGTTLFNTNTVEVNPKFPGGINEFLKTVGNKYKTPAIEESRKFRVIVYFVVEKDGTLSNITVPNDPGFGLGAEAIRVLKAIKTKWEPGYMGKTPVRTSFSLPIVVQTGTIE